MAREHEDATGKLISVGDTVTLLNSSSPASATKGAVLGVSADDSSKLVVQLRDGSDVTLNPGDVRLADRSYMEPGMVVVASPSSSPSSTETDNMKLGKVMRATAVLDLCRLPPSSPDDHDDEHDGAAPDLPAAVVVARAVSLAEVRRAGGEFSVGDYVVVVVSSVAAAGPGPASCACAWLGRVVEVCLDVDVRFDDGATCRVARGNAKLLTTPTVMNTDFLYPGQRVRGTPTIFRASRWLKGRWNPSHGSDGTVSRVETTSVIVHWIASSSHLDDDTAAAAAPANQQSPGDLNFFYSGNDFAWGVGDRCFFRGAPAPSGNDDDQDQQMMFSATAAAAADRGLTMTSRRRWLRLGAKWTLRPITISRRRPQLPLAVDSTCTTVDVQWQDGTQQRGVPSTSLEPVWSDEMIDQEFFPGQRVVRRTPATTTGMMPEKEEEPEPVVVGVVRGFNYKDRTVRVSWTDLPESGEEEAEETLSSYDLSKVSDRYYYGDIVVRRLQIESTDDVLSWVGHIVDTCDDNADCIKVKWGNGSTSMVLFNEIAVIKERIVDHLLDEFGEWVDGDGDMNSTNGEDKDDSGSNDGNSSVRETDDDGSGRENDSEDGGHTSMRRIVIQAAIRLASKLYAQCKKYLVSGLIEAEASRSQLTTTERSAADAVDRNGGFGDSGGSTAEDKAVPDNASGDDMPLRFPQFEIVQQSPSDHHYLDNIKQGTGGGRKWTKRVQKEWEILANNNLPDTIYVQAFEDRMDLLRAVMVGANGTPYHDGLFFFDLQLPPSSYPAEPPLVSYRSFGLALNPNLDPSGTVCLSLLNTFDGHDETEVWSPEASTVLQVVVSIQGLVLTAKPYYNEPAWAPAGTPMAQRNELPYSESAFLRSVQTMLHLLRRPPAGFEELVRDHFRRRGQHVIRACQAYLDGCVVGTLDEEGNPTESSDRRPCVAGFRIALLNVLPRLVEAFASIHAQGC